MVNSLWKTTERKRSQVLINFITSYGESFRHLFLEYFLRPTNTNNQINHTQKYKNNSLKMRVSGTLCHQVCRGEKKLNCAYRYFKTATKHRIDKVGVGQKAIASL